MDSFVEFYVEYTLKKTKLDNRLQNYNAYLQRALFMFSINFNILIERVVILSKIHSQ